MKSGAIKEATPESQLHVLTEEGKYTTVPSHTSIPPYQ